MNRVNPFDNLDDFQPTSPSKPVETAVIEKLSQENRFPSRQPPLANEPTRKRGRRYITGRDRQINIKATAATIDKLYRLADRKYVPLGELLAQALDALERSDAAGQ
jgi:hypothetical protein